MTNLEKFWDILLELEKLVNSNAEKGSIFENLCKRILEIAPLFRNDVKQVWKWSQFPGNNKKHDRGIDLVVLDHNQQYWAIQCKFYQPNSVVAKKDIDSFIAASTSEFSINGVGKTFARKYLFTTTDHISCNAEDLLVTFNPKKIANDTGIEWAHFDLLEFIKNQKLEPVAKKELRDYQVKAVNNVINGFKNNDRGKLIMACGSGKTFTALKIVEQLYQQHNQNDGSFNVLYLVPSISLLSQTIVEWKCQTDFINVRTFGICSDATAANKAKPKKGEDELKDKLFLMPIPPTTDLEKLVSEYQKSDQKVNIFFSTYQSIDVVIDLAKKCQIQFAIAVCDEAHRTIGGYDENNVSNFVKIHDSKLPIDKRLYMTATEKIYSERAKNQARNQGYNVYSMDQEKDYGPRFHWLSFNEAIENKILCDYRVIVFEITNIAVAEDVLSNKFNTEINAKIIASLNAISKNSNGSYDFSYDPDPMKRVIAFCSTIKMADNVATVFNQFTQSQYLKTNNCIRPKAKLIQGSYSVDQREERLEWLRNKIEDDYCHILTNARCLTEGIDLPSLDGVVFMNNIQSQVDIIQAVGRVMRTDPERKKQYGYVIIPVFVNSVKLTDQQLSQSDDYKTVWRVIAALRSHDEKLDNKINKSGITGNLPDNICVVKLNYFKTSDDFQDQAALDTDHPLVDNHQKYIVPSEHDLKKFNEGFKAALVKNCGNRLYWEDWSVDIGNVTNSIAIRIQQQLNNNQKLKNAFDRFLAKIRYLLNPTIKDQEVINMLAEHVVTLPVLKIIFKENSMINDNPVTKLMESMVQKFDGLNNEITNLDQFYQSVAVRVEGIDESKDRQELIRTLFEKFFQHALPKTAEKFGIVYTPIEIVDFIINSVSEILKKEFNQSIAKENIKILDPFTGTGTFIVRLLEKFKELGADNQTLKNKYLNDVWCNEINLLAYYIALINIEDTYGKLTNQYLSFNHAVLTDTFQLSEKRFNKNHNISLFENDYPFQEVYTKTKEEDQADIKIIIGNPPYYRKQKSYSNNNASTEYSNLDQRIKENYVDSF
ncbi:DEAD/DEAH box helicase / adenine-specific DNA methyltransferase [[Mycoplasma] cavipharyngis]|uniref:restriction endonuclease n=1 Tax=[Mycoplasma] cavipharyngis TaxID=92757 RepID=UPI003703EDB6